MKIIVVRHCPTILNKQNRLQGQNFDEFLTMEGEMQASELAKILQEELRFHDIKIDKIYVSPTRRTRQTASIICPEVYPDFDERLLPYDMGDADGLTEEEAVTIKRFPNPLVYRNMENFGKYICRAKSFVIDLLKESVDETIMIVTHEDITALIEKWLGGKRYFDVPHIGLKNGDFRIYDVESHEYANNIVKYCQLIRKMKREEDYTFFKGKLIKKVPYTVLPNSIDDDIVEK